MSNVSSVSTEGEARRAPEAGVVIVHCSNADTVPPLGRRAKSSEGMAPARERARATYRQAGFASGFG